MRLTSSSMIFGMRSATTAKPASVASMHRARAAYSGAGCAPSDVINSADGVNATRQLVSGMTAKRRYLSRSPRPTLAMTVVRVLPSLEVCTCSSSYLPVPGLSACNCSARVLLSMVATSTAVRSPILGCCTSSAMVVSQRSSNLKASGRVSLPLAVRLTMSTSILLRRPWSPLSNTAVPISPTGTRRMLMRSGK